MRYYFQNLLKLIHFMNQKARQFSPSVQVLSYLAVIIGVVIRMGVDLGWLDKINKLGGSNLSQPVSEQIKPSDESSTRPVSEQVKSPHE